VRQRRRRLHVQQRHQKTEKGNNQNTEEEKKKHEGSTGQVGKKNVEPDRLKLWAPLECRALRRRKVL
jgi:hypothetical protein